MNWHIFLLLFLRKLLIEKLVSSIKSHVVQPTSRNVQNKKKKKKKSGSDIIEMTSADPHECVSRSMGLLKCQIVLTFL